MTILCNVLCEIFTGKNIVILVHVYGKNLKLHLKNTANNC